MPEHVSALAVAREASDIGRLWATVHKSSGMLATFSTPVGELASATEDLAAAGELAAVLELAARVEVFTAELMRQAAGLNLERLDTLAEQNLAEPSGKVVEPNRPD